MSGELGAVDDCYLTTMDIRKVAEPLAKVLMELSVERTA